MVKVIQSFKLGVDNSTANHSPPFHWHNFQKDETDSIINCELSKSQRAGNRGLDAEMSRQRDGELGV
ncbi:hypothetical protein CFIMG_007872RA00001 [Ceratocystis fimbriata CBS 114723]|uniref:Uncharacterized protein n=1 Tax=Ceratocystis fimbriata CBS 114723 TaxID=1035309 RepID=A0A2C5WUB2_9PEZI|nr:hypothetical protein CFIMG_007872RA00001 [Ceratocystis fimbriata CBS 114723]